MEPTEYEKSWEAGPLEDAAQVAANKKRKDTEVDEAKEFADAFNASESVPDAAATASDTPAGAATGADTAAAATPAAGAAATPPKASGLEPGMADKSKTA